MNDTSGGTRATSLKRVDIVKHDDHGEMELQLFFDKS